MLTKINHNNFDIYTEEIIHPEEFLKLYKKEKILTSFKTNVNKTGHSHMATFLAMQRRTSNIKAGEFVIFRAIKENIKFEFISKITLWGRFSVPKTVIDTLNISNREVVHFEVIKINKSSKQTIDNNVIDLGNLKNNINIIYRDSNLITIVKNGTTPITLSRYISITPDLIELCYLIHGDGHYNTKLFFVNKDIELIRFVMDKFEEILRIPKETWRARLLFNHSSDAEIAKEKWKTNLNLRDEQFYPTISKCTLNTSEFGNLRIVIDKLIVAEVFRYIFSNLQNPKGKNALYALNGLLSAEGSAEKTKDGGLHKITISYSSKEKEMFKTILQEVEVYSLIKDREDRFVIEGWRNCYKFFKIFFSNNVIPFNLHIGRRDNALSGFLEHGFTKTMEKYLTILNKKEQMNTNELMSETNHLGNSVRKILRREPYISFIKSMGRGINRNPIIFSITQEGKEFLKLTQCIKEAYEKKNGLR